MANTGRTAPWKWTMAGAAFGLFAVLLQAFHTRDVAHAAAPQNAPVAADTGTGGDDGSVPYVPPYATGGFYRDIPTPPTYGGYGGYGSAYSAAPTHTRSGPS